MNDALAHYMIRPVPRYTSYPTAPHFGEIAPETYGDWLGALEPREPISLYLHVPFCSRLCWYCGCNMKLAARYEPVHDYVDILLREIEMVASRLPARMSVSHLHWGGGSPTTLAPDDLERAMAAVAARFDFAPGAELAIECDPRSLSGEMIERIGALGFNRASIGVQEFDPKVQQAINRIQPPDMVREAVDGFRAAGVDAINFDLIYGLPHQTVDMLAETVAHAAEMRPNRLALFGYAHVPWMAKKQRLIPNEALPGMAERSAQAKTAAAALVAAGYQAVGLDHFALPDDGLAVAARAGDLRRNFQGYTTDRAAALIGLGASSIGRTPHGFVQNVVETGAWARAISEGVLPVAKGRGLAGEDRLRGHVIERLMCDGAVDLARAAADFGAAPDWPDQFDLSDYASDCLVELDGPRVVLTEVGRTLARVVASTFDAYYAAQPARHSVAV